MKGVVNTYNFIDKIIPSKKIKSYLKNRYYNSLCSKGFGKISILLNEKEDIYGKFKKTFFPKIKHRDYTEEIERYLWGARLNEGDVVVDAGAYHGEFAIYAAKKVGRSGKVICMEPNKDALKLLKKNISLNNLDNIKIIDKGLWSKKGDLSFSSRGASAKIGGEGGKDTDIISVTTLDEVIGKEDCVKFIKMDIEGAEIEAMNGAKRTLQKKPIFSIASYHIVDGEKTSKWLEKFFKKEGYSVSTPKTKHQTTHAWKNEK